MSPSKQVVLHLLPNAHLDPVWLWDWREGLNEGIITVQAVLNLMDEFPDLTFMRGESAIYQHIQSTEPETFKRIRHRVEEGRWDVVGGTVIQPDTNLASTEVLCREFERGLEYFEKNLGVRPTVAWQADSFGHTPGLPNILSAFGMEAFSFTRPQEKEFSPASPAFWWEGDWGNRILCYRQYFGAYCSDRANLPEVLDLTLQGAQKDALTHACVLFGLGNHGGGPTRRHLREVQQWREAHPEVEVRYDTLHGFFADLKKETAQLPESIVPVLRGEFGYCLRGCYSSVQKFKSLYRNAEARIADAEITRSAIAVATGTDSVSLDTAWDALAFNAFHDILPGSSIERAMEDQMAWLGGALHRAHEAKFKALNQLAAKVNTTVPAPRGSDLPTDVPVLVWNPLPRAFKGLAELEVALDHMPLWKFKDRMDALPIVAFDHAGEPTPFQIVDTEHSLWRVPWRWRVVLSMEIPALGWTTVRIGFRDKPEAARVDPVCRGTGGKVAEIGNGEWSVSVANGELRILRNGKNFFAGEKGLGILSVEDPWGSWGGMREEEDACQLEKVAAIWKLRQSKVLERGPLRAKLWTRWKAGHSWIDLTFSVEAGAPELRINGRMLLNERSTRIKLVLPCEGELEVDMPGGQVVRDVVGQTPCGRWARRSKDGRTVGFASDVFSDIDVSRDELRVTLARVSRYANDVKTSAREKVWQPAVDCGELKFQCALFPESSEPDQVTEGILFPPSSLIPPATKGPWERRGSLGNISPSFLRLLSLEELKACLLKVRVQNRSAAPELATIDFGGKCLVLGTLGPQQIGTYVLAKGPDGEWEIAPQHPG